MIVHKFGGTSVGDAKRIANVANIIAKSQRADSTVVIVSAMNGVTNQLISAARAAAAGEQTAVDRTCKQIERIHLAVVDALLEDGRECAVIRKSILQRLGALEQFLQSIAVLGELTARGRDAVVGFGEHFSTTLLAAALRCRGTTAEAVSATDLIVTDDTFGAAKPRMQATSAKVAARVLPLTESGIVPVITGYVGATAEGVTTTLGRSGSDFSAAIIAACLDAAELRIWTDVDGILTADPNVVSNARVLRELSYQEAAQLARFGAEVLHPRTIGPVIESGIPLRIVNSFNPSDPGTRVSKDPDEGRPLWPSIVSVAGLRLLRLRGCADDWGLELAIEALRALAKAGIDVLMFSQSVSEQGLVLVVREADTAAARRGLLIDREDVSWRCADASLHHGMMNGLVLDSVESVGIISVIGFRSNGGPSIVSRAFAALGECGVSVLATTQAASEDSVSFCVSGDAVASTVRLLHRTLEVESKAKPALERESAKHYSAARRNSSRQQPIRKGCGTNRQVAREEETSSC